MSVNKVILIGNLTDDATIYEGESSDTAVVRFSVATNEGYGENKRRSFHKVVMFGKYGIGIAQYLKKGRHVYIDGSLNYSQRKEDDGSVKYYTDVKCEKVVFL